MKRGHVYLIGAGPGDPGLITQKALNVLANVDCIIYDFLSNSDIIQGMDCEKIYVGKKGSDHTLPQDEINQLLILKAKDGKRVARLKGGDSFIFGRGGEEAEELVENGITYSVIPGISSFYSAPAYAGIPLTHRDYANSFEVITGHRRGDAPPEESINLPEYDGNKTFVFLMGMKNLDYITDQLINSKNFPEETPIGIISWGTTPRQRVVTGTLKNIVKIAGDKGIRAPAIIIIGGVVLLRDRLKWFDNLPLFGIDIVVTRTREQASILSEKLLALGAGVIEFPTIEIVEKSDLSALRSAIENIENYNWIIFTSQNAVKIFFKTLENMSKDARSLFPARVAAIGPATAKELMKRSIKPDMVPSEYVAEEIIEEMKRIGVDGANILLPCAQEARETLKDGLIKLGARVDRIHIYDTIIPGSIPDPIREEIKSAGLITFTSSSTARNFFTIIKDTDSATACIGPITADAVKKKGHTPDIIASEYTIDGLVEAIVEWRRGNKAL
ncbi:MAG: uroporphyrinogen-III C-methyltransferase [Spirochaetota bacterium]|nr:uroporphyrinogen-III C-methyltransferase [Spirochaetota bacterium]